MTDDDEFDHDDYAKENCACGHRRYAHSPDGPCQREVYRLDKSQLPEPIYGDNPEELPFGGYWPINWPNPMKPAENPMSWQPCPCRGFHVPDIDPDQYF